MAVTLYRSSECRDRDSSKVFNEIWWGEGCPQSLEDDWVVAVGRDMRSTGPSDHIRSGSIEVEDCGAGHSHAILVDRCLLIPVRWVSLEGRDGSVAILVDEVEEGGGGWEGSLQCFPGKGIIVKET